MKESLSWTFKQCVSKLLGKFPINFTIIYFFFTDILLSIAKSTRSQLSKCWNFLSSIVGLSLKDIQNRALNPVFDGLSFGIKFIVPITSRQGWTPLAKHFWQPCTTAVIIKRSKSAMEDVVIHRHEYLI